MDPVALALARRLPVTPEQATFLQVSSNYAVTLGLLPGNIDPDTGEDIAGGAARRRSVMFPIRPSTTYRSASFTRRYFYDAEQEFIEAVAGNSAFITPANAAFMRFTTDVPDTVQLNLGSSLLDYEEYYEPYLKPAVKLAADSIPPGLITSDMLAVESVGSRQLSILERSSNLADRSAMVEGMSLDPNTGELTANALYATTPFLPVMPGMEFTANAARFSFYRTSGSYVGRVEGAVDGSDTTATVPAASAWMRVAFFKPQWEIAQLNAGDSLLPFEEFYERIRPEYLPDSSGTGGIRYQFDAPVDGLFLTEETYPALPGAAGTDSDAVLALYDALAVAHPSYITVQELGDDALGNRIAAYHFNPEKPVSPEPTIPYPKIFITCGLHGYEKISPFTTYYVLKHAIEQWRDYPMLEAIRFNVDWIVIPVANPSGWQATTRKNHNGVDINRNFPASSWVAGDPESSTYGGTEPASELETQYIIQVFEENPGIAAFYDFHNFHDVGAAVGGNFLWVVANSPVVRRQAQALITRMTRVWRDEHAFVTDSDLPGYVSGSSVAMAWVYAREQHDVELGATFETSNRWMLYDPSQPNIPIVWTSAINAFANWLLLTLKTLSR